MRRNLIVVQSAITLAGTAGGSSTKDADHLALMSYFLQDAGHKVKVSTSGNEALKKRRMEMDGVEAMRSNHNQENEKKKILVVDDDSGVVKALEIRLKHWGYEVLTAYGAEECFQVVEKKHPDLVLLDILMPGLDGVTACSKLRSTYDDLPVIMVSVLRDSATRHDASLFGALEYITKPVDTNELRSKVKEALDIHNKNEQTLPNAQSEF